MRPARHRARRTETLGRVLGHLSGRQPCPVLEHAHLMLDESFVGLAERSQNGMTFGGTPREHRSGSLSAEFRKPDTDAREDLTRR